MWDIEGFEFLGKGLKTVRFLLLDRGSQGIVLLFSARGVSSWWRMIASRFCLDRVFMAVRQEWSWTDIFGHKLFYKSMKEFINRI